MGVGSSDGLCLLTALFSLPSLPADTSGTHACLSLGRWGQPTVEGTAQSGWPSCFPYFLSSLGSSLPNIWSTHLARTSAYWGHPISNQLPPTLRDFLSREAAPLP